MKKRKKGLFLLISLLLLAAMLAGCGKDKADGQQTIKIGVTSGPYHEILQKVQKLAKKQGIDIQLTVFNDFIQPNQGLEEGSLDANAYQTIPFLENYKSDVKKSDIVPIWKTVTSRDGLYSNKYKNVKALPKGATIGIPKDPANTARALYVLQQAGLVKIKKGLGEKATPNDVISNPKHLKFKLLDEAMLPRSVQSLDASIVLLTYALDAGLDPAKQAIFLEKPSTKYTIWFDVLKKDKDKEVYKKLRKIYQSKSIKDYIEKRYKGLLVANW